MCNIEPWNKLNEYSANLACMDVGVSLYVGNQVKQFVQRNKHTLYVSIY